MNLNKLKNTNTNYSISLDIGTSSTGWAVLDESGNLCYHKGKPAWGSRLFESAEQASSARLSRGQRRRYIRRRWRLDLLQSLFESAMQKVDSDFFMRLRQSRLLEEDRAANCRNYRYPFFNDSDFTEVAYYKQFPTIYHLRKWLAETDEKADLRLIYLALHNIVKHRGNFLRQGETLSAKDTNTKQAVANLCEELDRWCAEDELACNALKSTTQIKEVLEDKALSRTARRDELIKLFGIDKEGNTLDGKKLARAVAGGVVGLLSNMADIFNIESTDARIKLSNEEQVEELMEVLPAEGASLFTAMQQVYAAFILGNILSHVPGASISTNKIAEYDQYGQDLRLLKDMVREYKSHEDYKAFFSGEQYDNTTGSRCRYNKGVAKGYTKYNLHGNYDEFAKEVKALFQDTKAESDSRYATMSAALEEGVFLKRLKTSENGTIPYQLHLEELQAIIKNQGKHYSFLKENSKELESLVTFRIPYYVGPLTTLNAPVTQNRSLRTIEGKSGEYRFAWAKRKEGHEFDAVKPWNWEDVIDTHASAEAFIMRLTGMCTYLQGEDVLPKESLLYQEYCVLNELNGARFSRDGDESRPFDVADREGIVADLFMRKKGYVSYKDVAQWMEQHANMAHVHVSGGQGEARFESKLSSYVFFCSVLGVEKLPEASIPMIENIILWNTLFEDRAILREKIEEAYGACLSKEQIKAICKNRMTGWGKLSRKLLCGIKAEVDGQKKSIMTLLREGVPNRKGRLQTVVFMEVLHDDNLAFQKLIENHNVQYANEIGLSLEDLPGSPALRRGINQALRIVDEIAAIVGKPPKSIFMEVTRGEDNKRPKGKRTKRRYEALKEALNKLKEESPEIFEAALTKELQKNQDALLDDRLMLYFMQGGKSLYSGKDLRIEDVLWQKPESQSLLEVDHIMPRAYIKDDSLDNKALVFKSENQRKKDSLLLDEGIQRSQGARWKALYQAGLLSEKKYKNLIRKTISPDRLKGFINRQLVETSQIIKLVRIMLQQKYQETNVYSISANLSHSLRDDLQLPKCREANDFHHAHDAYLAGQIGRFVQTVLPGIFENPIANERMIRAYIKKLGASFKPGNKTPGSSGYIIGKFLDDYVDTETGELVWDYCEEISRLKKCLEYKQCFISVMPQIQGGAFWDDTIYSPRSGKNLSLPLKEGLDPAKYGSYSREQFAYFFVYMGQDRDTNERFFGYEGVPVRIAAAIEKNPSKLKEFAKSLAEERNADVINVVRTKVYKSQLIELGGERFYARGLKEVRNGTQIAFSQHQLHVLSIMQDVSSGKKSISCVKEQDIDEMYAYIQAYLAKYATRLAERLSLSSYGQGYLQASYSDRIAVILGLIALINASSNVVNLSSIGGAKFAGTIGITFSHVLKSEGITFIDQSVTGMFERRIRVGF